MVKPDMHDDDIALDAHSQYMRQVRWTAKIDQQEEERLLHCVLCGKQEQCRSVPDQRVLAQARQARDELMERLQPFVLYVARRFLHRFQSMDLLDLVQEANLGLLQALDQYDVFSQHSFRKFVGLSLRNALRKAHRDRDAIMRISHRVYDAISEKRRIERELLVTLGREPSFSEIADAMSVSEEKLTDFLMCAERKVESLQGVLREDQHEDTLVVTSLYEASNTSSALSQDELTASIEQALETLHPRQRQVIRLRYGFDGQSLAHPDIEAALGMTKHASSSYEVRAKRRLHRHLAPLFGFEMEEVA